jgi:hypothetical protein
MATDIFESVGINKEWKPIASAFGGVFTPGCDRKVRILSVDGSIGEA